MNYVQLYASFTFFIIVEIIILLIAKIVFRNIRDRTVGRLKDNKGISDFVKDFAIEIVQFFIVRDLRMVRITCLLVGLLVFFLIFTHIICFLLMLLFVVLIYFLIAIYYNYKTKKLICKINSGNLTEEEKNCLLEMIVILKKILCYR